MKVARIQVGEQVLEGKYKHGVVTTDIGVFDTKTDEAELLTPCLPSAIYCVGRNFGEKVDQMGYDVPEVPDFFIKPPVALHNPETPIKYPSFTNELTYAGELAAVIGRPTHNISPEDVERHVRGYTILNDLDCLDQERRTARKAFNGSGPLGPCIATEIDPVGLEMETHINGELRQNDNTERMIIKPREIISFLSARFTLSRNDVISFGSPANPGLLKPADEIEIRYENIGTLRNTVKET
jgi:2-keto-4-pentenoate hydratase/2-oxohepta-3-ene-1,7-dioic acid hydratase in catechol pathway